MKQSLWGSSSSHLQCAATLSWHTAHIKTDVTCYYSCCCLKYNFKSARPPLQHPPAGCESMLSSWRIYCCHSPLPAVQSYFFVGVTRPEPKYQTRCELAYWGRHYFILWFHKPQKVENQPLHPYLEFNDNTVTNYPVVKVSRRVGAMKICVFKDDYQEATASFCLFPFFLISGQTLQS